MSKHGDQLGQSLAKRAEEDPVRFAALAMRMPPDLPASCFDAILRGVADCGPPDDDAPSAITPEEIASLIRYVHALPQRPHGRAIAGLIERWVGGD